MGLRGPCEPREMTIEPVCYATAIVTSSLRQSGGEGWPGKGPGCLRYQEAITHSLDLYRPHIRSHQQDQDACELQKESEMPASPVILEKMGVLQHAMVTGCRLPHVWPPVLPHPLSRGIKPNSAVEKLDALSHTIVVCSGQTKVRNSLVRSPGGGAPSARTSPHILATRPRPNNSEARRPINVTQRPISKRAPRIYKATIIT